MSAAEGAQHTRCQGQPARRQQNTQQPQPEWVVGYQRPHVQEQQKKWTVWDEQEIADRNNRASEDDGFAEIEGSRPKPGHRHNGKANKGRQGKTGDDRCALQRSPKVSEMVISRCERGI